jgi:hypothetical protein
VRFGPVAPLGRAATRAGGPFCILPRRCRPTLARVGLQGGARAHQEQPVDGAQGCSLRVGAVRGLTVQRGAVLTRVAEELHELN